LIVWVLNIYSFNTKQNNVHKVLFVDDKSFESLGFTNLEKKSSAPEWQLFFTLWREALEKLKQRPSGSS